MPIDFWPMPTDFGPNQWALAKINFGQCPLIFGNYTLILPMPTDSGQNQWALAKNQWALAKNQGALAKNWLAH